MPADSVALRAPAKVNLYLEVGGMRPDGFHDVTTVLHALEFHDVVSVTPASDLSVSCDADVGVPSESNTAFRAAVVFGGLAGRSPAVAIRVEKRIPHAAGLGGGSADAAAVIVALARLWGLDPMGEEAVAAAAQIGADVPFFLVGGAALFAGRGDRLVRSLPAGDSAVVLVNPGVGAPTPSVYRAFDSLRAPSAPGPRGIADALRLGGDAGALSRHIFNSLAPAAEVVAPEVAAVRSWLSSHSGIRGVEVAGSGATVFGLADGDDDSHSAATAAAAAAAARERGWWATATRLSPGGVVALEGRRG